MASSETGVGEQGNISESAPAGWYQKTQWPGERYWDGSQWTDDYRQPGWHEVKLDGPRKTGGAYAIPAACCACGSPAGLGTLTKRNTDSGKILANYSFPLCDRCAAIEEHGRAGLFAKREEKEAWKGRKEEWERVDGAVTYAFHSTGYVATFKFRNRRFADAFRELNLNPPKPAEPEKELLLRTIDAHRGRIMGQVIDDCAVSPDATWIVSACRDKTLRIWDAESGEGLRTLKGHKGYVERCAVSPDGTRIVSQGLDKTLRVWDAQSGEELRALEQPKGGAEGLAISPDGKWIASGAFDKTMRIWDVESGEQLRELGGYEVNREVCAVSPDGAWILVFGDKDLRIRDAGDGTELRILEGHEKRVNGGVISPDGSKVVSASKDKTLKVWDAESGACLQTLSGHTGNVNFCRISPDGSWVVSGSNDSSLRIWDLASGIELLRIPTGFAGLITACAVSPDGAWFVTGDPDGRLKVWDASGFAAGVGV